MKKPIVLTSFLLAMFGYILSQTGTIQNVKPSGGKLNRGRKVTISWMATGTSNPFKVILWKDGTKIGIIADPVSAGNGTRSISWQVGKYQRGMAPLGKGYRIRVKELSQKVFAMSDTPFEIARMPMLKMNPKPTIQQMFDVPLGALKMGTRLYIKGANFGTKKGEILMYGNFPINPVPLTDIKWVSSKKVNGVVPKFSATGLPDQTVEIRVKTAKNLLSNARKIGFEGRREIKMVPFYDVIVLHCGDDGNSNYCNNPPGDEGMGSEFTNSSIFGYHRNDWGAIGDDSGYDQYQINLKNGWKFKDIQIMSWKKSSGDEVLSGPSPPFPVGATSWTTAIHWKVTPADTVFYKLKVLVEGPLGTHYK